MAGTTYKYSGAGLALTRQFEGCKLTAYADQGGVWTIGYGHTGPEVHSGLTMTQDQVESCLEKDLSSSVDCVNRLVTANINQNQFDALVDFVFNLGCGSLATSQLLRCVNAGKFDDAAAQFQRWAHIRAVLVPGLLRRRQAEAALFSTSV
jgi:lysozyme